MEYRQLGRTGLQVSQLSLGGLFVASFASDLETARATTQRAVERGVNYIDTAPTYADSEQVLGQILPDIPEPLILSTKLGGKPEPFEPQNVDCLRESVKQSLKLLKRDTIDILMVHEPDRPGQYDWWTDWANVDGPVMQLLDELKQQGVIRFTGVGGTTVTEMTHIVNTGKFDVLLTAFNYSLLWREAETDLIPAAAGQNMGIVVGSALQQGALARRLDLDEQTWMSAPRRRQFQALYGLLDELGLPIVEVAMRFVVSNPHVSCVLSGARSPQEIETNIELVEKGPLPQDVLDRLDEVAAMVPFRPCEEPFGLPTWGGYTGPGKAGR